jgi:hypothetical protein
MIKSALAQWEAVQAESHSIALAGVLVPKSG